ncbi:3051_t:CDS:10 [Diversispora eburnea]|uniref:3051_t:CDS:1 n=1 Tax=Diversispora eburnea TaxID=1213867 RepID=A0A9N8V1X4_9GLOM|nr:3051_t:CDS:10 [Diversispora eburnea]
MRLPIIQKDFIELENVSFSEDYMEKRRSCSSDSFTLQTSTELTNDKELENSKHLYVPSNQVTSIVIERFRTQKSIKSEYIEVCDIDDDSDSDPVGKIKKQKILDIGDVHRERNLAYEAMPPLIISVVGLMFAGWLLDLVQHWPVFNEVPELFVLVPVLLNLKGNLEMNLASRLSTSANLGELDKSSVRYELIWGNLAVLQVQSLIVGAVAGLFSFTEGVIFHPIHVSTYSEIMLIIVSSMVCAALSSMILGTFMCILIILSQRFRINPDLLTLIILANCGEFLLRYVQTYISTIMFMILATSAFLWIRMAWVNKYVRDLLINGWTPLFIAMIISSVAGLVLEKYIEQYTGLALLTPVLNGVTGNLGSIYASRISTRLHGGGEEDYRRSEITLFLIHIPIEVGFLIFVWWSDVGHVNLSINFLIIYLIVSVLCLMFTLILAKKLTLWLWNHKYDPDNYSLPYITAIVDVIGTGLLVLCYWGLQYF